MSGGFGGSGGSGSVYFIHHSLNLAHHDFAAALHPSHQTWWQSSHGWPFTSGATQSKSVPPPEVHGIFRRYPQSCLGRFPHLGHGLFVIVPPNCCGLSIPWSAAPSCAALPHRHIAGYSSPFFEQPLEEPGRRHPSSRPRSRASPQSRKIGRAHV